MSVDHLRAASAEKYGPDPGIVGVGRFYQGSALAAESFALASGKTVSSSRRPATCNYQAVRQCVAAVPLALLSSCEGA